MEIKHISSHILTLWTQVNSGFPISIHPPTVCGKCMWCVNKRKRIRKGQSKMNNPEKLTI